MTHQCTCPAPITTHPDRHPIVDDVANEGKENRAFRRNKSFFIINILNTIGVLICSYLAIKPLLTDNLLLGGFAVAIAAILTSNIIFMRITYDNRRSGIFTSFIIGAILSSVLLLVTLSVAPSFSRKMLYQANYDKNFIVVYVALFLLVSVLAFILERIRDKTRKGLLEANKALREASMVDPLTGLKNRRFLGLSMPEELARVSRQRRMLSAPDRSLGNKNMDLLFLMVDLDHFKSVNDTYGHAVGDQVLQQASALLRGACREADIIVRWGGEEFLIVARNAERLAGGVVAEKLWRAIREHPFDLGHGVTLHKTCSVGFAAYPVLESFPEAHSWEESVELADQCLFAAKNSGRDGWVGVLVPDETKVHGDRLLQDLEGLAEEGLVQVLTSFPAQTVIRWNLE